MCLTLEFLYELESGIFNGARFPQGFDPRHSYTPSRSDIISEILYECGCFETLYTSPANFNREFVSWANVRFPVWEDLFKTTVQRYELLHNYDRTEEWTEKRKNTFDGQNKISGFSKVNESGTSTSDSARDINRVEETDTSSYSSGISYQPREKRTVVDGEIAELDNGFDNEMNSSDSRNASYNSSGNDEFTRTVRAYGNIGVTTAQQMLEEERRLVKFSLCRFIVEDFKARFCVLIY